MQILSVSSTEETVRHFSGFATSPSSVKSLVSHKMYCFDLHQFVSDTEYKFANKKRTAGYYSKSNIICIRLLFSFSFTDFTDLDFDFISYAPLTFTNLPD
ncbi:hypothetical protein QL285_031555 [Trifolium repens]|nr:hypothetical protein QL285_031555 [Trifolium repens]